MKVLRYLSPALALSLALSLALVVVRVHSEPITSGAEISESVSEDGSVSEADAFLLTSAEHPQEWRTHGGTYAEQRFSPLDEINQENVGRLGLAWSFETGTQRGLEATPIVVDGVMYATASWSIVYALDAATGKQLWRYDPMVPRETGRNACCDVVNRGVAVWKGRVYVGTLDRPQNFLPEKHVHTGEQVPWLHLADGLPRYLTTSRDSQPIA